MICEEHKRSMEVSMGYDDLIKNIRGDYPTGPTGPKGTAGDYPRTPTETNNMTQWHPQSQFRQAMTKALGPNFDILFNYCCSDSDYYGKHIQYNCEAICIEIDRNFNPEMFYELLLDHNAEVLKMEVPEWSLLRHVNNDRSVSEYNPASDKVHIKLKMNGHVFAIYFKSYGRYKYAMHELCASLKAMDSKSPNYKLYLVQKAIDRARMRVLGEKYNREFMFTRLL